MWLIRAAMRKPITLVIVIIGVALMSLLAIQRMKIDIFPDLAGIQTVRCAAHIRFSRLDGFVRDSELRLGKEHAKIVPDNPEANLLFCQRLLKRGPLASDPGLLDSPRSLHPIK